MFTAAQINAAIAAGQTVTAVAADLPRKHQPARGRVVTLTEAWSNGWEIRATAEGFRGRFRVESVEISGVDYDAGDNR